MNSSAIKEAIKQLHTSSHWLFGDYWCIQYLVQMDGGMYQRVLGEFAGGITQDDAME